MIKKQKFKEQIHIIKINEGRDREILLERLSCYFKQPNAVKVLLKAFIDGALNTVNFNGKECNIKTIEGFYDYLINYYN